MNDFLITLILILGAVFIVLPAIAFLLWVAKEYIKFMIEQISNSEEDE